MEQLISVIVPFYKGNAYMAELLSNLEATAACLHKTGAAMEVIVVNDSPDCPVCLPASSLDVTVIDNPQNMGIHASRLQGIRQARGQWIQLLDQDDLLIPETYPQQLMGQGDVTVGNCLYQQPEGTQKLYACGKAMQYLICEKRFLTIRNLIASPGHCLLRRSAIPQRWLEEAMTVNGSDDYYLWMLLFQAGARLCVQPEPVYIHRISREGNLSADLAKMHASNGQMLQLLAQTPDYPPKKQAALARSVQFKYLYDTKTLRLWDWLRYSDRVFANVCYKIRLKLCK